MHWTKLDTYDYTIITHPDEQIEVLVNFENSLDPTISDLWMEVASTDNHIYCEGVYFIATVVSEVESFFGGTTIRFLGREVE